MPHLKAEFQVRGNAPFGRASTNPLTARIKEFQRAEQEASRRAADVATRTSRNSFRYIRPPGPQRPGRESSGGQFPNFIEWTPARGGGVALDLAELDAKAPHWPILELGTGKSARMKFGGAERGVSNARSAVIKTIPRQRGRRIHPAFVFGTGPGGSYTPPGAQRGQQLLMRHQVTGAPRRRLGIVIKKEIKGQHFIQKGARAGFREYRRSVLAAARRSFRKGGAP